MISSYAIKIVDDLLEGKSGIDVEQFVEPILKTPFELIQCRANSTMYYALDSKLREEIGLIGLDEDDSKWHIYASQFNTYIRGADYKKVFDTKEEAAYYLWKMWLRHIGGKENHVNWMERRRRFRNYPYEQPPLGECLIAMNTSAEAIANKLLAKPRRTVKTKPKANITAPNYSGGMSALPTTV